MKKCNDIWQELSKNKKEAIAENAKNYPILTAVLSNCLWSGIHIFGFDGLSVLLGQITAQDAETALKFAYAGYVCRFGQDTHIQIYMLVDYHLFV